VDMSERLTSHAILLGSLLDIIHLFSYTGQQCYISLFLLHNATQGMVLLQSMTLRYRDHIGWNSLKIISWLVRLGLSLFVDRNIMDLVQREHHEILARIRVAIEKSGFWHTCNLKRGEIGPRLLLSTNRKSHTWFRLVSKSDIG